MSRLGMEGVLAPLGVPPGRLDPIQIPVDPVHRGAVHGEPATAVHPGAPAAQLGDPGGRAADLAGQLGQRRDVQRPPVVETEVGVRVRGVLVPGPAAAQHHPGHTGDGRDFAGHLTQTRIRQSHPGILPHGPRSPE
jgi:hypothetical protein